MKRCLSGMRPTGPMHIGHYFGALSNWRQLVDKYECFFMIADWHALMSEQDNSAEIRKFTMDNIIDWIASGIDPARSTIFIQSEVPEHTELTLILSCITPLAWLERNPTYKEQIQELKNKDIMNYAFLGYPVLQTSDIILYQAEVVPVGEDQIPHIELARELVRKFHHTFKTRVFVEPYALLTQTPRLLGLDRRKMSKSYNNYIALSEKPEGVKNKIASMITDPKRPYRTDPGHPDECNSYTYHTLFNTQERCEQIYKDCPEAKIGCVECKQELAEKVIQFLKPIQEKREEILKDIGWLKKLVEEGNKKARDVASQTLKEVKKAIFGN